ncbi:peptidoglycan-binding protein [Loktanella sp. IMCC34160]|nr:trypsin-like peptidase domain-containing protein [Loktanella sp. IMCC34160]RYG93037.1 peptidoglycan-binding protein [Loktanella sp. IMCC34160]
MMRKFAVFIVTVFFGVQAVAQDIAWVQVEAQPTLAQAQDRARAYAQRLDNVNGYYIGSGWYGIALGPYGAADAERLLSDLRRSGQIPADSFIADGRRFQQQFWPVGVGAETTAQPLPSSVAEPAATDEPVVLAEPEPEIAIPDETPREARASEAALTREERMDLQVALQWAGYYNSAIDGAFGRGTRASMQAWQEANNHEPTGILTTGQRAELFAQYNAVLDGMNLTLTRDAAAGIELLVPAGVMGFNEYEPPFAKYGPTGDLPAQLLLISQEGDQNRLFGLYEILQTLEIIPTEGPRSRDSDSFTIDGQNDSLHSHAQASLRDGQIKGFILVWPAGDEERRSRVLAEMIGSFAGIDGVLDPAIAPADDDQAIDLVSGLQVRQPRLSRSGFYITGDGAVLTTAEAVGQCESLTIDETHEAEVAHVDAALGIAVLRTRDDLAPMGVAEFQTAIPRLQDQVAVGGFPYGGVLSLPTLTFGKLADIRGLNGEEELQRLALTAQPGDAGGPVFDNGGAVLGMLLPKAEMNGQMLPPEVSFTLDSDTIVAALEAAGVEVQTTDSLAYMPPETLTLRAADMTVLVSCW